MTYDHMTARQLLDRMFEAEMACLAHSGDTRFLAEAFDTEVVVREPESLPYRGEWRGHDGVGALFKAMNRVWSSIAVEDMRCARDEDRVFMACTLRLTARTRNVTVSQPFAQSLRFRQGLLLEAIPFYYDTAALIEALGEADAGKSASR